MNPDDLVNWLCFAFHRQRGHLETEPPFTVPCGGREARFLHRSHRELNPGPSRGSPLHHRCSITRCLRRRLKDKYPNFEVGIKCILMMFPYLLLCSF